MKFSSSFDLTCFFKTDCQFFQSRWVFPINEGRDAIPLSGRSKIIFCEKKIALTHMAINLVAILLYAINIWLRVNHTDNTGTPIVLSGIAVALLGVSSWLGGEMVYAHEVGVDDRSSGP